MLISKVFVVFFALLVSSVIAAPVLTDRSLDEVELLPRRLDGPTRAIASRIRKTLRPKPNGTVFWSGRVPKNGKKGFKGNGVSVKKYADKFAKNNGKETVSQAMKRTNNKIPNNNKKKMKLWEVSSKVFALHASGDIHAILGSKRRDKNIYDKIEKPTLMNNPKVTKLTEHNVVTGKTTVVKDTTKKH